MDLELSARRVYFFLPLHEALSLPERPYVLELRAPIAGTGQILPAGGGRRASISSTGSVSLLPRTVEVPDTGDVDSTVAILKHMNNFVPWATGRTSRLRKLARWIPRRPSMPSVYTTLVEASVFMPPGWVAYSARTREEEDPVLEAALEDVVEAVNILQNLDYILTKRPTSPVAPQTLPAILPFAIGVASAGTIYPAPEGATGVFVNHLGEATRNLRRPTEHDLIDPQMLDYVIRSPFEKTAELMREADALLRIGGNYRAGVILAAAASESLVDTLLMFLYWESGRIPEDVVQVFKYPRSIRQRVKSDFQQLLGDSWDESKVVELNGWVERVVVPRNQVVHFGARVDRIAAEEAWAAFEGLRMLLANRLWSRAKSFPVTNLLFFRGLGMLPNASAQSLRRRMADFPEEPNIQSLDNWIFCLQGLLNDQKSRQGSFTRGGLLKLVDPAGGVHWIWHDWTSSKACRVRPDSAVLAEFSTATPNANHGGSYEIHSIDRTSAVMQVGEWVEEHVLVPNLQVLADQSDLLL